MRSSKKLVVLACTAAIALAGAFGIVACSSQSSDGATPSELANADVEIPQSSIDGDTRGYIVEQPAAAEAQGVPTMDKHADMGVATCEDCHMEASPTTAPLSDEGCKSCHNVGQLIEATAGLEDTPNRQVNPHDNHMHGTSCTSCHHNHGDSVVACNDCHTNEYDWMVP